MEIEQWHRAVPQVENRVRLWEVIYDCQYLQITDKPQCVSGPQKPQLKKKKLQWPASLAAWGDHVTVLATKM